MFTVHYSEKHIRSQRKSALVFIALGFGIMLVDRIAALWWEIELFSVGAGQVGAGLLMLLLYRYQKKNGYLRLENDVLTKYGFGRSKVRLSEVKKVKEFAGDLTVSTASKELVIDTKVVALESEEWVKLKLALVEKSGFTDARTEAILAESKGRVGG